MMIYAFGILAIIGHFSIFVAVINRIHAGDLPKWLIRVCNSVWYVFFFGVPTTIGGWYLAATSGMTEMSPDDSVTWLVLCYCAICCMATLVVAIQVTLGNRQAPRTSLLVSNDTFVLDIEKQLGTKPTGDILTWLAARIPKNEIFQLSVHEKNIEIPRLDAALEGLTIAHISDFHFTGQILPDFFHSVIEQANELSCDLALISGDIIDKRQCLPWIVDVLGELRAIHGCYYVLGNHDKRMDDNDSIRSALHEAGLIDLGGRWIVVPVAQGSVVLAGNELPWYVPAADFRDCPYGESGKRYIRIAVSHSPDQFDWARAHDVDLLLAGHTHGGQFRIPRIGPVLSPSRLGVRFASGTFFGEPTVMHVSRGISGTRPLRFNCRPELAKLVLRCANSDSKS